MPSRLSVSTPSIWSHTDDSVVSEASESSLIYRELAFDDDLFTARVYKRNYRCQEVRQVKREIKNENSTDETPKPLAVSTTVSNTPRTAVPRSSSATGVFELPATPAPLIPHEWTRNDEALFHAAPKAHTRAHTSAPPRWFPEKFFEEQHLSEWGTHGGVSPFRIRKVVDDKDDRKLLATMIEQ